MTGLGVRPCFGDTRLPSRFWSKVRDTGDCWMWAASTGSHGYGSFHMGSRLDGTKRRVLPHRLAYTTLIGPIDDGLELDHLCREPLCVNPSHLEPVTHTENVRRGNGWSGRKARQTHCIHGHEFTAENTYRRPSGGGRECRRCIKERKR